MTDQGPQQQPTPPPVPPPMPSGAGAPADLGTRFLARLIDHIILGIVIFVIIVPLILGAIFVGVGSTTGFGFGGFGVGSLVTSIVIAVLTIGYFALMESRSGQTLGKMAMSIKTVGPDGNPPSMEAALKRNSWYALGIVPFIGGLAQLALTIYIAVTISQNPNRIGWHDTFAGGTRVIKTK